jgi:hypothetical protein
LKWFRFYNDAVDDEKLRLLAFEDRWHYTAILCLKSDGLLDTKADSLRDRKIALKLGLTVREAEEVKRRLSEVGLINNAWQPKGWKKRQYEHDSSKTRTKAYRERLKEKQEVTENGDGSCDVTVTTTDTDTDTEKDSREYKFAQAMFDKILKDYPTTKKPNLSGWAKTIERTCRIDKRTIEELWRVFEWANTDDFWSANILSPEKLRKKFDQLAAQMLRGKKPSLVELGPRSMRGTK